MPQNIAKSAVERTSKRLLDEVFVSLGKVKRRAVEAIFDSILRVGSPLVKDIALSVPNVTTSRKGLQEKVSGWLLRYDFAAPVHDYLWREGARLIGPDTVIAVDSGDISKEFGGKGMEGMEIGYDASRGVTAMGHCLLCAAIVLRRRATAWRLNLIKGRKGLPNKERELFNDIVKATGGKGIPVHDRGFDSEEFIAHVGKSMHRAVVRIKTMTRDLFGTGKDIEEDMASAPAVHAVLRSPTRHVDAAIRWRSGFFPVGNSYIPVLVVSSTFGGKTLYLYALNFTKEDATPDQIRKAANLAANAYFCRWSVEVLFQDIKQCFSIEGARVRKFKRLENLLALCTLAYTYYAHVLPYSGEDAGRLFKTMKDTLHEIVGRFRPFVTNVRELLRLVHPAYISGRPRKVKPPDLTPLLPGFIP